MNSKKLPRTNNEISAKEVRLLDEAGQMLGVFSIREAIRMAESSTSDLIEISPNGNPPVCKLGNFGKLKYELQKKESEERKKNKIHDVKEVKFSINIAAHDFEVKVNHIREFIESGYSIKISCAIRGRDRAYGRSRLPILFEKIAAATTFFATVSGKMNMTDNAGDFTIVPKVKVK